MGNRAFRRPVVLSGSRRQTQWIGIAHTSTTVDNSTVLVASLGAGVLSLRPFTVVRIHMIAMF